VKTPALPERTVPLLAIKGLRRSFGEVEVLPGVDVEVRPGEAVAVVGPNGRLAAPQMNEQSRFDGPRQRGRA
jgi:ABC-type phosphonate transport system ATPase subunit